jgi:putative ABC transport system ATP-binding protein
MIMWYDGTGAVRPSVHCCMQRNPAMSDPLIVCDNLIKIYELDAVEVVALQGIDLTVQPAEVLALVGASGSGKTTLLNILGGLDRPSSGRVLVAGYDLRQMSDRALDHYRARVVGFVWQQKARNLIPYLTIEQQIALPMMLQGVGGQARRHWTRALMEAVGLTERAGHRLAELSGGEQQRVAIAIALANRPRLLLADEPTGELDSGTAATIFDLFHTLSQTFGLTVVIVSHDPHITTHVDRVVMIHDGRTASETRRLRRAHGEGAHPTGMVAAEHLEESMLLDSAGRLHLPKALRERYGFTRRVIVEERPDGLLLRPADDEHVQ